MVSPNDQPASSARRLAARICGFRANLVSRNRRVPSVGREYSHDSRPRANMLVERSASLRPSPSSASAVTVIDVRGTVCTA